MYEFTITKATTMGQRDETYGQAFWCEVSEDLKPVKFNTTTYHQFVPGDKITCEESLNKRSIKGKDYLQLKKVQLVGESQPQGSYESQQDTQPQVRQPSAGIHEQLNRMEYKLDKLLSIDANIATETAQDSPNVPAAWQQAGEALRNRNAPAPPVTTEFNDYPPEY